MVENFAIFDLKHFRTFPPRHPLGEERDVSNMLGSISIEPNKFTKRHVSELFGDRASFPRCNEIF